MIPCVVCRRIGDMALEIRNQLIDRMKQREFNRLLEEATHGSRDAHLICYVRFVDFSAQRGKKNDYFASLLSLIAEELIFSINSTILFLQIT